MELLSPHPVAVIPRIAPVFHNNIHRYLRSRRKLEQNRLEIIRYTHVAVEYLRGLS
jgi:hypothetical protein